ncbi:uncharacterized protein LOC109839863 [Asparagus officinalis]|uniref:uncharacterized protein LOC109839863 n=1 Tax=Asparagus officinalis TaxID=4686 RepID=UPI00098DFAC1|nr:uncharacterized protein LOC109839863 [Asparagus officinalis]
MPVRGGRHGPSRGLSRGGRGSSRPNASPVGDSSGVYCFRCGHPYHKANNCFAPDSIIADTTQAFTAMHLADQIDHAWYPDTGATNHMTADPTQVEGSEERPDSIEGF